jgi:hypothetical protein
MRGGPKLLTGTNPAANVEISEAVPVGKHWLLYAVSVSLVQGITQTPQPILIIDDGSTGVIFEGFGSSAVQAVSTTTRYNWAPGLPLSAQIGATTDVHATAPLPEGLVLKPGYRIRTNTLGKGANSDYGAPVIYVVEYDGAPLFD